jgi:hypothetical protein
VAARVRAALLPSDPIRVLQANTLIVMLGYGLYIAGSALFFVRADGIPAPRVGLGFSLAGLAGLAVSVRIGRIADRFSPRDIGIAFALVRFALLVAAVLIRGTARSALIGRLVPKSGRTRMSAVTRVLTNIGFSVGVAFAGIAIGFNSRTAYMSLILGMALASLLTALLGFRLPRAADGPGGMDASGNRIRYDYPYMAVSFVSSMTLIGNTVLTVGLPIWVVAHTGIPRPLAAWMILVNTLLVIALQVKFSSMGSTVAASRRIQRWSFVVLAAACCTAAATYGRGSVPGTLLLFLTVGLLTLGELWGETANWTFRYGFAQAKAQGAYGGMFILAGSGPTVIGPVVVTFLTARFVPDGWFVLALIFVVCMALNGPVISWAERTRNPDEEADPQWPVPTAERA